MKRLCFKDVPVMTSCSKMIEETGVSGSDLAYVSELAFPCGTILGEFLQPPELSCPWLQDGDKAVMYHNIL